MQRHAVGAQIDARLLAERVQQPVDDAMVEVLTAEERVPRRRLDLEDPLAELQDRDVEGAAAEVVDGDLARRGPLVHAVGQRRRRRLVDDAAGVLGRLPLRVVEVRGDGDDRLADLGSEVILGQLPQMLEQEGTELGR